ncbi:MAG: hypothetical protein V1844_16315 [Pseudomonadota bacterium]
MPMKTYSFDEKYQDLIVLCEYPPTFSAFDVELELLMAEARADGSDRRSEWVRRLKALQARQLQYKLLVLSVASGCKYDGTSGCTGRIEGGR